MAGRGRGRGRGLVITTKSPVPGGGGDDTEASVEPKAEEKLKREPRSVQALNDFREEMKIVLVDRLGEFVEEEFQRLELLVSVIGDIQEVARTVYGLVKENHAWVKGCAVVCERLSALDNEGTQFRSAILRMVQEDYKDRERLREMSNSDFLSCMLLLSHLLVTMRLANGEVMQALISPVFDCLELVLHSDAMRDGEGDVVHDVLILIGQELQFNDDERMQDLMICVRTKIIEQKTKPMVRGHFLEVVEMHARRWQSASNDVTRFYLETNAEMCARHAVDGLS